MNVNRAVIGLGSNINAEENIRRAKEAIAGEFMLIKSSSFVETEPVGFKEQDRFINGALLIETELNAARLESRLKVLETELGRVKTDNKYGPRSIDLDILVWNGEVVDEEVYEREFLRTSINELMPDLDLL
ncbi:MAG: 2-amino-4-hydroxy-6-hydroxymethyldihydropteridine diphosphokinase [Candidatus Dadabacteria bacterium RIFCSPHIGHO2_12_FULL_53_21]|nr:MAG: 2-amino-4-hydroxy-6-hydroxymethyldihydropteridine diphosphokinase [Candidatus Dadabacteria bacterium RIFCSPHIGHO2_12_FULL_53_21]